MKRRDERRPGKARGPRPQGGDPRRPAPPAPMRKGAPPKPSQKKREEDERPSALARAGTGEWDAFEELLGQTVAPIFDAALHLRGDADEAAAAAEEALFALLIAVRRGLFQGGDPLKYAGRELVRGARGAGRAPFPDGLVAEDLIVLGIDPADGRGPLFGKLGGDDRVAVALDVALDLELRDLAYALEKTEDQTSQCLSRAFAAVPSETPRDALRDVLDARASRVRLAPGLEDRVLDRLEAGW